MPPPPQAKNVVAVGSTSNSPLSFYERGLDAGMAVLALPASADADAARTLPALLAAAGLPATIGVAPAAFGVRFTSLAPRAVPVLRAVPADACRPLSNAAGLAGAAVLVTRGSCPFSAKAAAVQRAGGLLMLLANSDAGDETEVMYPSQGPAARPEDYAGVAAVMLPRSVGAALARLVPAALQASPDRVSAGAARSPVAETVVVRVPEPFILDGHHEHRLSAFSSRGPTRDGRIKPDLVAPGEYIVSARSDGSLDTHQCSSGDGSTLKAMQGTSMAAPAAAAAAVLVREYLMKGFYPSGLERAPLGVLQLTPPHQRGEPLEGLADEWRASERSDASWLEAAARAVGSALGSTAAAAPPLHEDAFAPSAALVKAALAHSAVAVAGPVRTEFPTEHFAAVSPPPSIYQGHGRIKLDNVLVFNDHPQALASDPQYTVRAGGPAAPSVFLLDHDADARERWAGGPSPAASLSAGETLQLCFDASALAHAAWEMRLPGDGRGGAGPVGSPFTRHPTRYTANTTHTTAAAYPFAHAATADPYLKLTLAYTDYPATLAAGTLLVNDLDLAAALTAAPRDCARAEGACESAAGWASAVFLGNHGADLGAGEAGRADPVHMYNETALSQLFYQGRPAGPSPLHTAAGHPVDDAYLADPAQRAPLAWDRRNNLEAIFISAADVLDVARRAAGLPEPDPARVAALARGRPSAAPLGLAASPSAGHDWTLSVWVHAAAVPHGPQPFALVASSLYGGDLRTLRLLPARCNAALKPPARAPGPAADSPARASPAAPAPAPAQVGSHTIASYDGAATLAAASPLATQPAGVCPGACGGRGQCVSPASPDGSAAGRTPLPSSLSPAPAPSAPAAWGCVCDGPAAGPDCSSVRPRPRPHATPRT
jgi:hypothetical protein